MTLFLVKTSGAGEAAAFKMIGNEPGCWRTHASLILPAYGQFKDVFPCDLGAVHSVKDTQHYTWIKEDGTNHRRRTCLPTARGVVPPTLSPWCSLPSSSDLSSSFQGPNKTKCDFPYSFPESSQRNHKKPPLVKRHPKNECRKTSGVPSQRACQLLCEAEAAQRALGLAPGSGSLALGETCGRKENQSPVPTHDRLEPTPSQVFLGGSLREGAFYRAPLWGLRF